MIFLLRNVLIRLLPLEDKHSHWRGSYLSEVATATLTIDTADKVYVGASSNSAPTDSDFIAMNSFFSFGDNEFPFTPY